MIQSRNISWVKSRYRRSLSAWCGRRIIPVQLEAPLISFTFDDFPQSALHGGGAILKRYGFRGTFYVSLGLMDKQIPAGRAFSAGDLRQLIGEGHDLGCHTFAHCHAWETKPGAFEQSIVENQRALGQLVPGTAFKSLSYPIDCPRPQTKRRAARYFAGCRGGGQTFNGGMTDRNYLKAFFLEKCGENLESIDTVISQNSQARGWLIFATHDVCERPTQFGCTTDFFENVVRRAASSGAKIVTVAKALDALCADRVS